MNTNYIPEYIILQQPKIRKRAHTSPRSIEQAQRLWSQAERIEGAGEWASVSYCPGGTTGRKPAPTICLYPTREEAQAAKERIDSTGCGGHCWGSDGHSVVHLNERERIAKLNADFFGAPRKREK